MQLTEQQRAVLALVAADVGVPADQFWIDERGAVFFHGDPGCVHDKLPEGHCLY